MSNTVLMIKARVIMTLSFLLNAGLAHKRGSANGPTQKMAIMTVGNLKYHLTEGAVPPFVSTVFWALFSISILKKHVLFYRSCHAFSNEEFSEFYAEKKGCSRPLACYHVLVNYYGFINEGYVSGEVIFL